MNMQNTLETLECTTRLNYFFGNNTDFDEWEGECKKDSLFSPRTTVMTLRDCDFEP